MEINLRLPSIGLIMHLRSSERPAGWAALRTIKTLRTSHPGGWVGAGCWVNCLYRRVLAFGLVEELAARNPTEDLLQQQPLLLLDLLQHAFVLLRAARQVWKDLVNWTVWNIFVGRVTSLTCSAGQSKVIKWSIEEALKLT